jgi:hypothetical protein
MKTLEEIFKEDGIMSLTGSTYHSLVSENAYHACHNTLWCPKHGTVVPIIISYAEYDNYVESTIACPQCIEETFWCPPILQSIKNDFRRIILEETE